MGEIRSNENENEYEYDRSVSVRTGGHTIRILRRIRRAVVSLAMVRFPTCGLRLKTDVPLARRWHRSTNLSLPRQLFVFLPGIADIMEDYETHGFLELMQSKGWAADLMVVDAHYGYYADRTILSRLREDIIGPAGSQGYSGVWLVGISLGGLGAGLYACHYPGDVSGLVLLAPFLGGSSIVEEITAAGGVRMWDPGVIAAGDYQRTLWKWLKQYETPAAGLPALFLGYGVQDKFASAHCLLRQILPHRHVFTTKGGHNWPTWKRLWALFLNRHLRL